MENNFLVAKKMKTLGVLQYSKSLFQIILDGKDLKVLSRPQKRCFSMSF